MDLRARSQMLGQTEDEIRSEMAAALGRISSTFEVLLQQLKDLDAQLQENPDEQLLEKYRDVLKDARLYYWYLIVQRESIGLRDHRHVVHDYAIPPSVLRK